MNAPLEAAPLSQKAQQLINFLTDLSRERDEFAAQADQLGRHLATALDRAVRAEVQRNELLASMRCIALGGTGLNGAELIAKAAIAKASA